MSKEYNWPGMIKISPNIARQFLNESNENHAIYELHADNTESYIESTTEIRDDAQYGLELTTTELDNLALLSFVEYKPLYILYDCTNSTINNHTSIHKEKISDFGNVLDALRFLKNQTFKDAFELRDGSYELELVFNTLIPTQYSVKSRTIIKSKFGAITFLHPLFEDVVNYVKNEGVK